MRLRSRSSARAVNTPSGRGCPSTRSVLILRSPSTAYLLAADAVQRAALLEVRGRLRNARRKMQSGMPASRWSAMPWRGLRFGLRAAAVVVAVLLTVMAAGIIASYAVSGYNLRTQVLLMLCCSARFAVNATRRKNCVFKQQQRFPLHRLGRKHVRGWTLVGRHIPTCSTTVAAAM